jgi:hypothetical protein
MEEKYFITGIKAGFFHTEVMAIKLPEAQARKKHEIWLAIKEVEGHISSLVDAAESIRGGKPVDRLPPDSVKRYFEKVGERMVLEERLKKMWESYSLITSKDSAASKAAPRNVRVGDMFPVDEFRQRFL